jgi:hypothetical protein
METLKEAEQVQAIKIVADVLEDAGNDIKSAVHALEDGAYLSRKNWGQEDVENAHSFLKNLIK